jgi:methionyl aminopeptidase
MARIRTEEEINILRDANHIVSDVLAELASRVAPGVTTRELDTIAEKMIRERGAVPSFLGYHDYPASTCISVDEVIVHGIPGKRVLKEGEIVSIDVGAYYRGYHGDAAITVACGEVDELRRRLMETTNLALARGIQNARHGNYLEDLSRAIQQVCEQEGFSIVRNFVGHSIGTEMHEEPQIPNFVTGQRGPMLREGMVLAIEPMVNAGSPDVRLLDDGWTAMTADGLPSLSEHPSLIWGREEVCWT